MRFSLADAAALLVVAAAVWLHQAHCEWRLLSYPIGRADAVEARLLVSVRTATHARGNAERFDDALEANGPRVRAWAACFDRVHGEAAPAERAARERCFAELRFRVHDPATRAVALAECERLRFGRIRGRQAVDACLAKVGFSSAGPPRFVRDALGPRYAGPYRERFGLWAEALSPDAELDRRRATRLGVALPLTLLAGAGFVAGARRVRSSVPWPRWKNDPSAKLESRSHRSDSDA